VAVSETQATADRPQQSLLADMVRTRVEMLNLALQIEMQRQWTVWRWRVFGVVALVLAVMATLVALALLIPAEYAFEVTAAIAVVFTILWGYSKYAMQQVTHQQSHIRAAVGQAIRADFNTLIEILNERAR
jgi:uncharacterized membrane protein YqjE